MSVDIVLGLQRGDEGKGRFVDLLAESYDLVARFNGGPNAGHTIAHSGKPALKLHQIPSGIAYDHTLNIIGNGALVDPIKLIAEMADVKKAGLKVGPNRLVISDQAHLILPHHISQDEIREASSGGQGSTKCGIAFVASDKYLRHGVRAELINDDPDKLYNSVVEGLRTVNSQRVTLGLPTHNPEQDAKQWLDKVLGLKDYIKDTVNLMHQSLAKGSRVLAEGAQAFGLDIDHGMYPFVTSSHTTTGGMLNGLGVAPQNVDRVVGVVKAIKSHVGGGPLVTKIDDETLAQKIRGEKGQVDAEYGVTTGRERAVGYLDLPELRHAIAVNGVTELAITKLDTLVRFNQTTKIAVAYDLNGEILKSAPSSAGRLEKCKPIYKDIPVWEGDISAVRDFNDLPKEAKEFIGFISKELDVKVSMIGVGPERDQVILV